MNLTLHQFCKDIRQFRIILPVWFLMLFLDLAGNLGWFGNWVSLDWQQGRNTSPLEVMLSLQTFFLWALFLIIPSAVVLADSPARREGFLRTRPLPGRDLFLAKALFVVGLVILPVLLQEAIYLSVSGLSLGYVVHGVAERLVYALPYVATAAAFASLWRSYAQWGCGLAIAFGGTIVSMMVLELACELAGTHNPFIGVTSVLAGSKNLATSYSLSIGAVILAVAQARTMGGPTRRWLGIAVGILISVLVNKFWSWDFCQVSPADPAAARSLVEQSPLTVPLRNIQLSQMMGQHWGSGLDFHLTVIPKETNTMAPNLVQWTCLQAQLVNDAHQTFAAFQPSGTTSLGRPYGSSSTADFRSWVKLLPDESIFLVGPFFTPGVFSPLAGDFSMDAHAPWLREPVTFKARMEGLAYRWEQVGDLPLTTPSTAKDARGAWSLLAFSAGSKTGNNEQSPQVLLKRSQVSFAVAADARTAGLRQGLNERFEFLIFDPQRQVALIPDNVYYPMATRASATALVQYCQNVSFSVANNFSKLFTPPEWAHCRLLIFERTWLGSEPVEWQSPSFIIDDLLAPQGPSPNLPGQNGLSAEEVWKRLAELPVPGPQASRADVGHYLIQAVPVINAIRNGQMPGKKVVSQLASLVPTHLDVLLDGFPALGFPEQGSALQAIGKGAAESQKMQIIAALPENPELMEVISQRGWVTAAHDAIYQFLDSPKPLSFPIIQAIASFHDPATYPRLLTEFEANPRRDIYDLLRQLPGLAELVAASADRVWQSEDRCIGYNNGVPDQTVLDLALHIGNRDAFKFAYQWLALTDPKAHGSNWELAEAFRQNVKPDHGQWDQIPANESVLAWMRQHDPDSFVFDAAQQRFVLKP